MPGVWLEHPAGMGSWGTPGMVHALNDEGLWAHRRVGDTGSAQRRTCVGVAEVLAWPTRSPRLLICEMGPLTLGLGARSPLWGGDCPRQELLRPVLDPSAGLLPGNECSHGPLITEH